MNAKAFEIRDRGTFIPAVAVQMTPAAHIRVGDTTGGTQTERERYLLRRAGFGPDSPPLVLLARMDANGGPRQASYDSFGWGAGVRTMQVAQDYIAAHWDELPSGSVICVEHIMGERATPKPSEQEGQA